MFHIFGIDALSVLIFGPALSAFLVASIASFGTSKQFGRWLALILSLLLALLSIKVFADYQAAGLAIGDEQFIVAQDVAWFEALGARWTLGIDGISAVMILLTGLLTPLAILASWNIEDRSNMHLALLLFFETGSMGVFAAMDLMVFFLFYELTLVPMYFLINQWGSLPKAGVKFSGRFYASTKFMIYSFGGTLGMLLATQLIGWSAGTFSIETLIETWPLFRQGEALLGIDVGAVKALAFIGFFVAFCIKVPIWPFHTWLPDAHGEAPTAGSMLLAGIMLKLGAYGFIRLVIPLFPDVWLTEVVIIGLNVATLFAILSVVGIVLRRVRRAWGRTISSAWWPTARSITWASSASASPSSPRPTPSFGAGRTPTPISSRPSSLATARSCRCSITASARLACFCSRARSITRRIRAT